jgi:hypothetical protein
MLAAEDRMSTILDDLIEEEERTFVERAPWVPVLTWVIPHDDPSFSRGPILNRRSVRLCPKPGF